MEACLIAKARWEMARDALSPLDPDGYHHGTMEEARELDAIIANCEAQGLYNSNHWLFRRKATLFTCYSGPHRLPGYVPRPSSDPVLGAAVYVGGGMLAGAVGWFGWSVMTAGGAAGATSAESAVFYTGRGGIEAAKACAQATGGTTIQGTAYAAGAASGHYATMAASCTAYASSAVGSATVIIGSNASSASFLFMKEIAPLAANQAVQVITFMSAAAYRAIGPW